jgi:uncharacterized 2Fe-2S/4Fe-4S cluster protein (DUF4445 family)
VTEYILDFQPIGLRRECSDDITILQSANGAGVGINSVCGGIGSCNACRIQVLSGSVTEPTAIELNIFSQEELSSGWRLACQTRPMSHCTLYIPPESMTTTQRLQIDGSETPVALEPVVKVYPVHVPAPSLYELRADADRLIESLNLQNHIRCHKIDTALLHNISSQLREKQWACQVALRCDEIISIDDTDGLSLGLAVDLGTSKIAFYLVDLDTGKTLGSKGLMNPQIAYGEDIISRLALSIKSEEDSRHLQSLVIDAINNVAEELCLNIGTTTQHILDAVVVGNTAMHHLFLGLSVKQLTVSPFVPSVSYALDIKARELHLKFADGAYVHMLPNIAGFVGADHVSALLATKILDVDATTLLIDIGTNTEISLNKDGEITAVSCASGPAFEGGHIKHGMKASAGAIERVWIDRDIIHYQTIDNAPPIGICGSGILDAVAQLYLAGVIERGGNLSDKHPRVRITQGQREFVLVEKQGESPEIVITQRDIRELQLAKGAIQSGIQALLDTYHCEEKQIQQVIIAGAFGNYIDIRNALEIGMLPNLPLERFCQVGNASGVGAKIALISLSQRALAQRIANKVSYLELANTQDFMSNFVMASYLGK